MSNDKKYEEYLKSLLKKDDKVEKKPIIVTNYFHNNVSETLIKYYENNKSKYEDYDISLLPKEYYYNKDWRILLKSCLKYGMSKYV